MNSIYEVFENWQVKLPNGGVWRQLTDEQAYNRNKILSDNDKSVFIINASAGTGKTTFSLAMSYFAPQYKFLLLTFNNGLNAETKKKREELGLKNISIYTFDGFMTAYFGCCRNENDLFGLIANPDLKPKQKLAKWDYIILDEWQDANYGRYAISQIILKWIQMGYPNHQPKIIVLGDTYQCIYEYAGADRRFIGLAHILFAMDGKGNLQLKLTLTHRCTRPMVEFINQVVLGYQKMDSHKPGIKPQLHICNIFDICPANDLPTRKKKQYPIIKLIDALIQKAGGDYGQIAIICQRIRNNSTIQKIANYLTDKGVPIYRSADEGSDNTDQKKLSENKLVFTSVHKSKGREWPFVIFLGFDNYWEKDKPLATCPDHVYVGLTRGEVELHLVTHFGNGLPGFINRDKLPDYVDIIEHEKHRPSNADSSLDNPREIKYNASELSRHMNASIIRAAISKLGLTTISPAGPEMNIRNDIEIQCPKTGKKFIEDVSAINGTAVPVWYECHLLKRRPQILDKIIRMLGADDRKIFKKYYNSEWPTLEPENYTVRDVLQMCNLFIGLMSGYLSDCQQMKRSNWAWISSAQLTEGASRIHEVIQHFTQASNGNLPKLEFEKFGKYSRQNHLIQGSIDLYTPVFLFEFKFKSGLSYDDVLQLGNSMLIGHKIGLDELLSNIDNDKQLESQNHIRVGHTVLLSNDIGRIIEIDDQVVTYCSELLKPNSINQPDDNIKITATADICADLTWLKRNGHIHDKQGILFNIRTGHIIHVEAKKAQLDEMLDIIIKAKTNSSKAAHISDEQFLANCAEIKEGIFSSRGIDLNKFNS